METTTQKIKSLRTKIHLLFTVIAVVGSSRALSLAKTNLERAKMFLGLSLKELGVENPYPNSMDASNLKIEPTADRSPEDEIQSVIVELNDIAGAEKPGLNGMIKQIKYLRAKIEAALADHRIEMGVIGDVEDGVVIMWLTQAYIALTEAKMWLGVELSEMNADPAEVLLPNTDAISPKLPQPEENFDKGTDPFNVAL